MSPRGRTPEAHRSAARPLPTGWKRSYLLSALADLATFVPVGAAHWAARTPSAETFITRGGHVPDTLSTPPLRVLVAGESWIKHTIHMKGFDQFHSTEYEEGAGVFLD
ncbi:glutamine amidotransferase, partial [Pseudonocardia sp.]|uniref:glutamine amidotransferase n=1 Tax=Pseudonocardia sp. TaxID=60912 RepID=UPI0031FC8F08